MPVRSLNSAVLKWPDSETVLKAVEDWAERLVQEDPNVLRVGCFGSYAKGDWGVGSDVDIVIICRSCGLSVAERAADFSPSGLPVPADVVVYTSDEFAEFLEGNSRMARELDEDTVWFSVVSG